MDDYTRLRDIIIAYLANGAKAYELEGICQRYEIECDKKLNPMDSKRVYLKSGFSKKNFEQTKDVARKIISDGCDSSFVRDIEMRISLTKSFLRIF